MKRLLLFLFSVVCSQVLAAQHSNRPYIPPSDSLVRQNLTEWQGLKFGLLMHWGTYSQWGIVESWSLCPEDEGWCERRGDHAANWYDYKKAYENLQTTFNPSHFEPDRWAAAAHAAGMRYVVFTTKHHDGFCMFDTRQTDYKITDPKCPFSRNLQADVTREIFQAFRKKGFKTGAYFSKPDWHSNDFWWSYFPPKDRNVNYDLKKYPERYQRFKEFTINQLEELCTNYGKLDILWLDGGWVRPSSTIDRSESWQRGIPDGQDVNMPHIAAMARQRQPGIIIVDRWIPGEFENYLTPEQGIPTAPLGVPWETCMTMGDSWSFIFEEHYKSPRKLIHTLCDIVSKGGNLLLNIAPGPDGRWHQEAFDRLQEIAAWMQVNSDAIYGTITPTNGIFRSGNLVFTQKGTKIFAIYLAQEGEVLMPEQIMIPNMTLKPGSQVKLLGSKNIPRWRSVGRDLIVWPASEDIINPPCQYAWVFELEI